MNTSPDYSNSGSFNPVEAFNKRRYIYTSVVDLQKLEHVLVRHIATKIRSSKQELLELMSTWLLNQTERTSEHARAETISGFSMEYWCVLQHECKQLIETADRLKLEAETAEAEYDGVAPWGIVSEYFGDEASKNKAKLLAKNSREKAIAYEHALDMVKMNTVKRQAFGKRFFRACLKNLQNRTVFSVFGKRAEDVVKEMVNDIESEWIAHVSANRSALMYIEVHIQELRKIYGLREGEE